MNLLKLICRTVCFDCIQEFSLLCQLSCGTTLGALKHYGILPWELDADIFIHPTNFTAFGKFVIPAAEKLGYKTVSCSQRVA